MHVRRYHKWMQDPVLRSQTASEPLTLEQEHEMQQAWIRDTDSKDFAKSLLNHFVCNITHVSIASFHTDTHAHCRKKVFFYLV